MRVVEPLGYVDFLALMAKARLVLTDSGGLQEETTVLGVPWLTMRENTVWPVTVTLGTNVLVGTDTERIIEHRLMKRTNCGQRSGQLLVNEDYEFNLRIRHI